MKSEQALREEQKTNLFVDFFDLCEEKGILLDSSEFLQISQFAIKDEFITYGGQNVKSLVDIKIETLSDVDALTIIKRARTGLKRILEMKKTYIRGPFRTNRKLRRIQEKLARRRHTTFSPSIPS